MSVVFEQPYNKYFKTEVQARKSFALLYLVFGEHPDNIPPFPLDAKQPVDYDVVLKRSRQHSRLYCPSHEHSHPFKSIVRRHFIDAMTRIHYEMKYERAHEGEVVDESAG